ncbi:hypothetical protein AOQ84DRAFT_355469 [Glonium stellatum]|uniref:Tyrosinase copper-binding domain-containing protein n=1 Tax=Glonium stellatum TaxID=574774 RepID=A0A8E2JR73_9PEZI|nr:hypothetical protein AOQ84DRAFT_355469 [Glonium stellatum]
MLNPDEKAKSVGRSMEILINEERSWESFANHSVGKRDIRGHTYSTVFLESFHDDIHLMLGTGNTYAGHTGNPRCAAFDPMF